MVKGISRRVVVVRPPDSKIFEEAFFIVREQPESTRDILREACTVAERYLHTPRVRRYSRKRYTGAQLAFAALGGGGMVGTLWAATAALGIF